MRYDFIFCRPLWLKVREFNHIKLSCEVKLPPRRSLMVSQLKETRFPSTNKLAAARFNCEWLGCISFESHFESNITLYCSILACKARVTSTERSRARRVKVSLHVPCRIRTDTTLYGGKKNHLICII